MGAAVSAMWASGNANQGGNVGQEMQLLLNWIIKQAWAQNEEMDTCSSVDYSPSNITASAQGTSGTYGARYENHYVTLDADTDFCKDSNGNDNTGDDLYASFTTTGDATMTCGSLVYTMSGSGVFQEGTYHPSIWASWTITASDNSEATLNCTIFLNEDQTIDASYCTIAVSDEALTMNNSATCTIDAG